MAKGSGPEVVALNSTQLEELLVKLAGLLPAETYQLVETLLRILPWVRGLLEAKNTTLGRRRRMIFELEPLRCALCGALFTAAPPPEAGPGKYDPSCGVMLNLQRFGVGQPMIGPSPGRTILGCRWPPRRHGN